MMEDRQLGKPIIPSSITVHLGKPTEASKNVTVTFIDYIKNVACSEIYPTWPENAIKANVIAQISFALNRIYNEWYLSKGYVFDITGHTGFDQKYINNREIFDNISKIVDEIFNNYIVKSNHIQPYFAEYCDGRVTQCKGLSQWGTVDLAKKGKNPIEILQFYYGKDIYIIDDAEVSDKISTYPGVPLKLGDLTEYIRIIKRQLNRISNNYPAIPKFVEIHEYYDIVTERTISKFQGIFNLNVTGIIDKATWYKIKYLYTSVKKLSELYSEGIILEETLLKYDKELEMGSTGQHIRELHYYLSVIAYFNDNIPLLKLDSIYDENTKTMVLAFQNAFNLPGIGTVDKDTWNKMKEEYQNIITHLPANILEYKDEIYPGRYLSLGMKGTDVTALQKMLVKIAKKDQNFPRVIVSNCYNAKTEAAIKYVQKNLSITENGVAGPIEWHAIVELSKKS